MNNNDPRNAHISETVTIPLRDFAVAALATDYGFTLEDVARANVEKLKARYPQGFVHGGGQR